MRKSARNKHSREKPQPHDVGQEAEASAGIYEVTFNVGNLLSGFRRLSKLLGSVASVAGLRLLTVGLRTRSVSRHRHLCWHQLFRVDDVRAVSEPPPLKSTRPTSALDLGP